MFGSDALPPVSTQQFTMPQKKGGMFGGGDWKTALMAAAAGFMARRNPQVASAIMGGIQSTREAKDRAAQAEAERAARREDWQWQYDYERQNPKPSNNDTVADYEFIRRSLGDDAARRYLETKTNPVVMTPYGPMPYSQVVGQGEILQTLPPGAKPLGAGGPTPPASGAFPESYPPIGPYNRY